MSNRKAVRWQDLVEGRERLRRLFEPKAAFPLGTVAGQATVTPISYTANGFTAGTAVATPSIASVPFGTAKSTRLVVCVVFWICSTARTFTSATIGGVAATKHIDQHGTTTNAAGCAIISALVPTGTSGTVVLTFSGAVASCGVYSYSIYDAVSNTPADTDGKTNTSSSTSVNTVNLTYTGLGVVISGASVRNGTSATWTDSSGNGFPIAEDYDGVANLSTAASGSAVRSGTSATARITSASSGSIDQFAHVGAAWA